MLFKARCMQFVYVSKVGNEEKWLIKEDAPQWAKDEFTEFMKRVNPEPDDNGSITIY